MKNKKLLILVLFLSLFSLKVYAEDLCSKNGYTVITINGIFTNENGALINKKKFKESLPPTYNNQPITVDYVYNPTHLGGFGDLVDSVRQGLFDPKSDYDLVEMLNSASGKVKTQKVLLVGHSQGNFYANSFYNKVVDKDGGLPSKSLGMYSVASPDTHVSGGGKYLTSDTDRVIAEVVGRLKNILTPNTHIELKKEDGNGHSFSDVYLKYRSKEIVADIKESLDELETNDIQDANSRCISPLKITAIHKVTGALLSTADFGVNTAVKTVSFANNVSNSLANTFVNLAKRSLALVGFADNGELQGNEEVNPVSNEIPKVEEPTTVLDTPNNVEVKQETEIPTIEENQNEDLNKTGETVPTTPVVLGGGHSGGGVNTPKAEPEIIVTPPAVIVDTVAPVITLNGESILNINQNTTYIDVGAVVLDNVDAETTVITTGIVDTSKIGSYVLTYSAVDTAGNIAIPVTRTVNVIEVPVVNGPDITPPVITLNGESIIGVMLDSIYLESGATAKDDIDGDLTVTITGEVDTKKIGEYIVTYSAVDKAGNIALPITRSVKVSSYVYSSKYSFGTGNGDGRDWQAWVFNGSNVYNWSDTYVNKYLREQFKLQTYYGYWTSDYLERGIFKHDPREGFENTDFTTSMLEDSPQNMEMNRVYDVIIQWDSKGYSYTILYDGDNIFSFGRVDVPNMNNNLWVGWDGAQNGFKRFPSGDWIGVSSWIPNGMTGGQHMMMVPYPVYNELAEDTVYPPLPVPSNEKLITSFNFEDLNPIVSGVIDSTNHTVSLTVPYGTNVKILKPKITISSKASINPGNFDIQDFTNPVTYTLRAQDKTTEDYIVTVTIAPDSTPPPDPDNSLPDIISYSLNGSQGNIALDPIANNLTIILNANKNVNWMTIQIRKEDEPATVYKTLQSNSTTCIDGTNICSKTWEGDLSKGGLLKNGNYKIEVHMQDEMENDYDKYLDSMVTVTGQSI